MSTRRTNSDTSKYRRRYVQMADLPFQVETYSTIRLLTVFSIIIGFPLHASSDIFFPAKYITKTYFERHDSYVDSEFSNFLGNHIPLGLSKGLEDKNYDVPSVSVLERVIVGEGSHRLLSSSIRMKMQPDLKLELTKRSCLVIVIERLPTGVFADPFELQHLVHRGVFSDAAVFGDTNLELPSFRSNQSVVEIHVSFSSSATSRHEDGLELNLEVPLHARYPPLGHGYSKVEFGQPDFFICCYLEEKAINRSCLLMSPNYSPDFKAGRAVWEIPCGVKEHAGVVSAVTFGFAIVAAFVIVLASVCYSDSTSSKMKHS